MILSDLSIEELREQLIKPLRNELVSLISQNGSKQEKLLTRKEAAKFLSVSLVTLSDWSNRGLIKEYRIGVRVYYKVSELLEAIK